MYKLLPSNLWAMHALIFCEDVNKGLVYSHKDIDEMHLVFWIFSSPFFSLSLSLSFSLSCRRVAFPLSRVLGVKDQVRLKAAPAPNLEAFYTKNSRQPTQVTHTHTHTHRHARTHSHTHTHTHTHKQTRTHTHTHTDTHTHTHRHFCNLNIIMYN